MTKLIMIKLIIYMVYLTMVKLLKLKLIMVQLPMKKIIKIKTNHNQLIFFIIDFSIKYLFIG
jgi:hypothetical protein